MKKIIDNLEIAKKYIKKVKRLHTSNKEVFLNNDAINLSISMGLFTILNSFIEIGEEIIVMEDLPIAQTYREIFEILSENKIINNELGGKLKKYMSYRNMIAYQYDKFNLENIFYLAENINVLEKFVKEIEKYIKNKDKNHSF